MNLPYRKIYVGADNSFKCRNLVLFDQTKILYLRSNTNGEQRPIYMLINNFNRY